jgi:hypothetical protein
MLPELVARLLAKIRRALPPPSTRDDPRVPDLDALAATRDHRAVPDLLPLLVANDALSPAVARTISTLLAGISPSQLNWLDAAARRFYSIEFGVGSWFSLAPGVVPEICRAIRPHWPAIGILASHPNRFVREIALRELGRSTSGLEIPYLTIRANDWVGEIAGIAAGLLAARLVPSNRAAVVAALPFIARMFDQRRQDHRHLADAFITVLVSDDLRNVLQAIRTGDRRVARRIYELLLDNAPSPQIIDAAISDVDPVVRRLVIRRLPSVVDSPLQTDLLATLAVGDRSPGVAKKRWRCWPSGMPTAFARSCAARCSIAPPESAAWRDFSPPSSMHRSTFGRSISSRSTPHWTVQVLPPSTVLARWALETMPTG